MLYFTWKLEFVSYLLPIIIVSSYSYLKSINHSDQQPRRIELYPSATILISSHPDSSQFKQLSKLIPQEIPFQSCSLKVVFQKMYCQKRHFQISFQNFSLKKTFKKLIVKKRFSKLLPRKIHFQNLSLKKYIII